MNVDEFVLQASYSPVLPPLSQVLSVMTEYVGRLEGAGLNPTDDPAVLVLGAYISFHTHSDINTVGGYRRLLDLCESRLRASEPTDAPH